MKKRSVTIAGIVVTSIAVTVVGTALSQPHMGGNIPNPGANVTVAYPKITLSCTGTGIAAPKIVSEKGWPNPPISTMKICTSASDCVVTNTPCWPYTCDPSTKACKTSCTDKSDCGALGACIGGQCQPRGTYCTAGGFQMTLDGTINTSSAYRCNPDTGVPFSRCGSDYDCAGGKRCNSDGSCS